MKLTARVILGDIVHEATVEAETAEELQACEPLLHLGLEVVRKHWEGEEAPRRLKGSPWGIMLVRDDDEGPWHQIMRSDPGTFYAACGVELRGVNMHAGLAEPDPDDVCEACKAAQERGNDAQDPS